MSRANEPAYPVPELNWAAGLTVREHFAGLAMQGVLCAFVNSNDAPIPQRLAEFAVAHADALIAELNRPTAENCRGCDSPTCTGCGR